MSGRGIRGVLRGIGRGRGWDFTVLIADRFARLPMSLLVAAAIGRSVGPEDFGRLSHSLALVAVLMVLAQLGLDLVVVRRLAREPEREAAILGGAIVARLLAGGMLWSVGVAVALLMLNSGRDELWLLVVLSLGVFSPAGGVSALWFQARTRNRVVVAVGLVVFVAMSALRLGMAARGAPLLTFAWIMVVEWALTAWAVSWAMSREGGRVDLRGGMAEMRGLLAEGWPLLVGALASAFYMKADILALRWLRGAEEAGVFAAATRLSEAAYGVPALLGMVFMAGLSSGGAAESAHLQERTDAYFRASTALGYALVLPMALVGPWLVPAMFGEAYAGAAAVAQVHAISVFFLALTLARGRVLVVRGRGRFTMVSALFGAVVVLPLHWLLIPRWGPIGAAWATVAVHALSGIGLTLAYAPTREVGLDLLRAMARPSFRGLR